MIQFLSDTLLRAADLALIAVGLSVVYSLIRFPNVAIVQYAVVGAFLAISLQSAGLGLFMAAAVAVLAVGGLALMFNVMIFERLLKADSAIALIGSLALSMVLMAVFLMVYGPIAYRLQLPVEPPFRLLGVRFTVWQLVTLGVSAAALAAFALLLHRTRLGTEMRAVATNAALAAATGIENRRIVNIVVFVSGMLAALGGITLALRGSVSIDMGTNLLLPVFASAVLGGLGNALGAIVGALVIAAAETVVTNTNLGFLVGEAVWFLPASYAPVASFVILVLFLLFRPRGLFVSEVSRV
ncbi:MAG TPA: branched-chain amino acid ABC transporter permease [Bosea sp. (in: a-proteobacteria)]|jgi:branched-chain amino acid transport system permease protein|uniref:branched-chain amino acid ABC transporter permease n=1 Tax=Bosea sp. (in: a-proteobacteria) TaxID=1871050 RepID=UPI002E0FB5F2|nr:branched-chain amino acid ABC transporter permease [Bosea sp. (in: a-proteobacteria)]